MQVIPSLPTSLSAQTSQNVEKSRNVHWLSTLHGFSMHVATPAPPNTETAVEIKSAGVSIEVLVMRVLSADVTDTEAPLGASLVRKRLSLMTRWMGPLAEIAPP